ILCNSQVKDSIRYRNVTEVKTCALPICITQHVTSNRKQCQAVGQKTADSFNKHKSKYSEKTPKKSFFISRMVVIMRMSHANPPYICLACSIICSRRFLTCSSFGE